MYIKIIGEKRQYYKVNLSSERKFINKKEIEAKRFSQVRSNKKMELDYLPETKEGEIFPKIFEKIFIITEENVIITRRTIKGTTKYTVKGAREDKEALFEKSVDRNSKIKTEDVIKKLAEIFKNRERIAEWVEKDLSGTRETSYEVWR